MDTPLLITALITTFLCTSILPYLCLVIVTCLCVCVCVPILSSMASVFCEWRMKARTLYWKIDRGVFYFHETSAYQTPMCLMCLVSGV
ncbi:hypothetical protein BDF14DRAFT_1790090 [Spinellus fusiger]|nr:hypothetical protein BDF14DRAFT_1790090 [Spinellus fusiger]